MPRPPRCRRICGKPQIDTFCPNGGGSGTPILLTLDEYEVIRLVDLEQRTHEQCAAQMDISRSTVQEIYESARQKIAVCLVHGKPLRITGGNYRICGGEEHPHCGRSCRMRTFNESDHKQKGEPDMKIAVTYENGQIFQHFGHTEQFKLYEVADGKIVRDEKNESIARTREQIAADNARENRQQAEPEEAKVSAPIPAEKDAVNMSTEGAE